MVLGLIVIYILILRIWFSFGKMVVSEWLFCVFLGYWVEIISVFNKFRG